MSDESVPVVVEPVVEPVPEPVKEAVVEAPAPAPAPAPVTPESIELAVSTAGVDLKDPKQLLQYALKVIAQIKLMANLKEEEKAALIVAEVKKAISASPLNDTEKAIALGWCEAVLPHVIHTVELVTQELKKVEQQVVASLKVCCPSFF
jgi:hypothetical protein